MKRLKAVLLTGTLALVCLPAWAGYRGAGYDYAKVVRANPIYQTVRYPVDEQVCWEEQVWQGRRPSAAPVVLGAVIGGVVGHQFGDGDGRTAMTVAGAAVGGAIGAQVARNNYRHGGYPGVGERCEMQRNWRTEQRITGWDVTYRYRGAIYHTRTLENPGRRIRVVVNARPVRYYSGY